jgi:hypothetical protein
MLACLEAVSDGWIHLHQSLVTSLILYGATDLPLSGAYWN